MWMCLLRKSVSARRVVPQATFRMFASSVASKDLMEGILIVVDWHIEILITSPIYTCPSISSSGSSQYDALAIHDTANKMEMTCWFLQECNYS